jgi:hypothetical protein
MRQRVSRRDRRCRLHGTSVFPQLVFDPVKEQLRDRRAATAALVCQDRVSSTGLPCFRRGGGSAARPICGRRARADALRRPYRIRASTDLRWRTDSPRECELSKDGSTATRHTRMRRDCPSTKGAGGGGSLSERGCIAVFAWLSRAVRLGLEFCVPIIGCRRAGSDRLRTPGRRGAVRRAWFWDTRVGARVESERYVRGIVPWDYLSRPAGIARAFGEQSCSRGRSGSWLW